MNVTLVDDQGVELTEITSHLGPSSGKVHFDAIARPGALFEHYFDRGSRRVTAVIDATAWSGILGTGWHMGARRWFLYELRRAQGGGETCVPPGSAALQAMALTPAHEPRGAPP